MGLLALLNAAASLRVGIITIVLYHGLRANGFTGLTQDAIGEAVLETMGDDEKSLTKSPPRNGMN